MPSPDRRTWVVGKYALLQVPDAILVGVLLWSGVRWWELDLRLAVGLFALWLLKDVLMFPVLRVAYEADGGRGGPADLIGARGTANQVLAPEGYIRIGAELWRARVVGGRESVPIGGAVRVQAVEGLTLIVEPEAEETP
ncbi:MAG: NfeD family protein [Myxococcota bacterium]